MMVIFKIHNFCNGLSLRLLAPGTLKRINATAWESNSAWHTCKNELESQSFPLKSTFIHVYGINSE
jgi:hypothetical protein